MRPDRTEAIILHTYPVRERDKLVIFLTPDRGKRKAWAYGARSMRSRFGAALEPLAKVHLLSYEKETEEVARIESAELVRSAFDAQQELGSSLAGTYIAETIDTFLQPDDPSEHAYRLLDKSIEALLERRNVAAIVGYVEVWMLRLGGVFPSFKECTLCHSRLSLPLRYDVREGFLCADCSVPGCITVANEVADLLFRLSRESLDTFASANHHPAALFELRAVARDLRRNFLGHELKSHDLLQMTMGR